MEEKDVKCCVEALKAKQAMHALRWRYYDGEHPIAFVNPKINEVIPNGVVFKKNYCQVIVNATRDRLAVQAWNHEDKAVMDKMDEVWKRSLKRTASMVHVAALATGEAYLVVWPGQDGKVKAYYHDPRQAHVVYDDNDPDTPRVACKTWADEKNKYLNLYYPERIEHYFCGKESDNWQAFKPFGEKPEEPNTYGAIPVFHFRLNPRVCVGELTPGVLSLQDAMNKLLNDLMVSSEFCSFPQRWGIGNFEAGSKTPIGPATMMKLPAGVSGEQQTAVGTFQTSDPKNYLDPIDNLAFSLAILSATPKHYFSGQAGDPSGEALQSMEAPLIAKVLGYQEVLGETWTRAAVFALQVQGVKAEVEDLECIWSDPHTVQPVSLATTRSTNVQAGIPIITLLRDEGWTEEQLEQLRQDKAAAPAAPAPTTVPSPLPTTKPRTPEEAAPKFDGVVKTPDMAGHLAGTGALSRAVNRVRAAVPASAGA